MLICLPGVPREMMHLMQETVEPFLAQRLGPDRVYLKSRTLRVVGMGESIVDSRIADLMRRSNPTVGLAAHLGQVDVRITARATTEGRAVEMLDDVAADVRARLGDFVYAEGDVSLETVVVAALQDAGYSLALVETNTGGEIARRLQAAPGGDQIVRRAQVVSSPVEIGSGGPSDLVSPGAAEWAARQLLSDCSGRRRNLRVCPVRHHGSGGRSVWRLSRRNVRRLGHRRQRAKHAHRYRRHGRAGPPLGWQRRA